MFGLMRFFLALLVVSNHIAYFGIGRYAVFAFFALSGFLMTAVLVERYGTSRKGLLAYAANRALRIYPVYLMSVAIGIAALIYASEAISIIGGALNLPNTLYGWFANLTTFGLEFRGGPRMILPSAWTLPVEMFYWALIPLTVILGRKSVVAWLALAIAYHVYYLSADSNAWKDWAAWNDRYGTFASGGLGFGIGILTYHIRNSFKKEFKLFVVSAVMMCAIILTASYGVKVKSAIIMQLTPTFGYYAVGILCIPIIGWLCHRRPSDAPLWFAKIDRYAGSLSYPLYLIHYPIGLLVMNAFGLRLGPTAFLVTAPLCILVATLMTRIEDHTNRLRDRVTRAGASQAPGFSKSIVAESSR